MIASGGYMSSMEREHGFEALRVEGRLPEALSGALYRVGPGLFDNHGRRYDHPFEADGAVCAVRFDHGRAQGAHRLVQSAGLLEERAVGKPLFGSVAPWPRRLLNGLTMRGKNAANTNLMRWQGQLYALYEVSKPTAISDELDTAGASELGGVLRSTFSAHPHRIAERDTMFNFGITYGKEPMLTLYELPPTGRARVVANLPFDNLMLHDFALSPRHAVFFVTPTPIDLTRSLLGLGPFDKLIRWEPERGTEVIVVPLDNPSATRRFKVDAFYQWHFAGAFERGDELIVDVVTYPDFASFEGLRDGEVEEPGRLTRVVVDPVRGTLRHEVLADLRCEFPRLDPRFEGSADYDRVWVLSDEGDRDGIAEVVLSTGRQRIHAFAPGQHVSEPVFVPRGPTASQGDGWLLGLVYDQARHQSHLAVLDTRRLEDEPVARVHFDHHVPMTFHGLWVS